MDRARRADHRARDLDDCGARSGLIELVILLALAASFCTATASVCQRIGARSSEVTGFDVWLVFRLARRPVWLLGIASMILGFVLQISALRFGPLALVQPILALELLFVFAYMAISRRVKVRRRDWLAAVAMSAGIGLFLHVASPSGGRQHAPGPSWWLAGLITLGVVLLALGMAFGPGGRPGASRPRRAALLGAATGISWGFVAAVIKELSSHLGDGIAAIFSNWSPYVLVVVGAATMLLASHALAAARSPPPSPDSRSWTRSRPACWDCSCSASTSRPGLWIWPAKRWPCPSSLPASRSSATATSSSMRTDRRSAGQPDTRHMATVNGPDDCYLARGVKTLRQRVASAELARRAVPRNRW